MNTAELHKKVMKEFGIDERSYNRQCFEGSYYIYEIVEFVKEKLEKEIKGEEK